ncbi:hypothetical protein Theco_0193 [Thermobacillus composti KWC4]|uniref:Uncharacterized protein n=1 Tax=Thermobacillus composti (strain DSM 18247 / JCM 13945 / KWC4) TaxID=717605 RepID=L0EBA8_THECK|nr:hypothetical protein Theco_0193 [Thermobacillus composti KWC4]
MQLSTMLVHTSFSNGHILQAVRTERGDAKWQPAICDSRQGPYRVFRGSQSVAALRTLGFNNQTSSLILVGRRLSDQEIRRIQASRSAPGGIVTIRQ